MIECDPDLAKWLRPRAASLNRATLGQLVVLMNLVSAESVADIDRKTAAPQELAKFAVNSRQKLTRLQEALRVGDLTHRVGKATRPTPIGRRVAGELRLFLQELRSIAARQPDARTWIVGAGNAWLQNIIIPALTRLTKSHSHWRWEVRDLRAAEIQTGLRDGLLHFGFLRDAEVEAKAGFAAVTRVNFDTYRIIVSDATDAPKKAKELVHWALENKRPLAQQGSTWKPIRGLVAKALGFGEELDGIEIHLTCQSHMQAIASVESGSAWCIVPSGLGRNLPAGCKSCLVNVPPDKMTLAYYPRALMKHADNETVKKALGDAIRAIARSL